MICSRSPRVPDSKLWPAISPKPDVDRDCHIVGEQAVEIADDIVDGSHKTRWQACSVLVEVDKKFHVRAFAVIVEG
jgi:hypothetical protein